MEFNKKKFNKVKLFFFLGEDDDNDSVLFDDGYDENERKIVLENFGKNLQERWKICEEFYKDYENCKFVLYPDVGHTINELIISDLINFYKTVLKEE